MTVPKPHLVIRLNYPQESINQSINSLAKSSSSP